MMKKIGKQNLEDSETEAVQFIAPDERQKGLVARSKDYVVIMHFGESLKGKIFGQNMDEHLVDDAFREYNLNMKNESLRLNLNFPDEIAKLESEFDKQSEAVRETADGSAVANGARCAHISSRRLRPLTRHPTRTQHA